MRLNLGLGLGLGLGSGSGSELGSSAHLVRHNDTQKLWVMKRIPCKHMRAANAYAWGSFDGRLCKFDDVRAECFATPLEEPKPNLGALVGDDYYYAKDIGRGGTGSFYWVENATSSAEPIFHDGVYFKVREDLYEDAVLDG